MSSKFTLSPDDFAVIKKSYGKALSTPIVPPEERAESDLFTKPVEAYKKGGLGQGILSGLTEVLNTYNSPTGQKIAAGVSGDPYLKEAYLKQSGDIRSRQDTLRNQALSREGERMKMAGDTLATERKIESDEGIADMQARTALHTKEEEMAQRQAEMVNKQAGELGLTGQEAAEFIRSGGDLEGVRKGKWYTKIPLIGGMLGSKIEYRTPVRKYNIVPKG